ncbi:MAG TPA: GNAT family N-acetyltransferase [Burkholderiaceae bacterium]|nr:GNAT family N-acetyltransferase [Burkholderiaceae bacterium]
MQGATFSAALLSRVEDAGLNASAPPQQRWLDGWLVRFCAGKAKRARCINAVATGQLPVADKLALCQRLFDEVHLPLIVRVTPMSQPRNFDAMLDAAGLRAFDDTRVMIHGDLSSLRWETFQGDVSLQRVGHAAFAQIVGQLRGSPLAQQQSHAQRLELSPVPFEGWVLRLAGESTVLACGQTAIEADMVGLYDVFTASGARNQGWARRLCAELLRRAVEKGARTGYLQVDASNLPARSVYQRLGFADGYAYHYRSSAEQVD